MNLRGLEVIVTDTTCGEACWSAREDICRCSCAGKNHGILRDQNSQRPPRMSKIQGVMYQLIAIGPYSAIAQEYRGIEKRCRDEKLVTLIDYGSGHYSLGLPEGRGYPVKSRVASAGEESRWPELAPYRERGPYEWQKRPYLLWIRADIAGHFAEVP